MYLLLYPIEGNAIFMTFVFKGPIKDGLSMAEVMTWCTASDKTLSEPFLTKLFHE